MVEPQTHFRGCCSIGDNSKLGPGTLIDNASLGDRVEVVQSVVREAKVGDDVSIGPFAHLRPAADVGHGCRIGNFVEVKKSSLGAGSKVNPPQLHRRRQLGRERECGSRNDHRELRRREQTPNRDRGPQQNRCEQCSRRASHHR